MDSRIADLVMLVRRLCRKLERLSPGEDVRNQALDYLARNGLNDSSVLRGEHAERHQRDEGEDG